MRNKDTLDALRTLSASDGWQHIHSIMQAEVTQAAFNFTRSPTMSQQEIDFQRGAMWAARQLLDLPHKLIQRLEAEVIIEESKATPPQPR